ALVIDRERSNRGAGAGKLIERYHAAAAGFRIDPAKRVGTKLVARINFQDHLILIQRRIDTRNVALTEGVIENGIDQCRINPEPRSNIPIDLDIECPTSALLIARNIGNRRESLQLLQQ